MSNFSRFDYSYLISTFWNNEVLISSEILLGNEFHYLVVNLEKKIKLAHFCPWTAQNCSCRSIALLQLLMSSVLTVKDNFIRQLIQGKVIFQTIAELWAWFSQFKEARERQHVIQRFQWKSCSITHLPFLSSNPENLKAFQNIFHQKWTLLNAQQKKQYEAKKPKRAGSRKSKRKSQDCCVNFKRPKNLKFEHIVWPVNFFVVSFSSWWTVCDQKMAWLASNAFFSPGEKWVNY